MQPDTNRIAATLEAAETPAWDQVLTEILQVFDCSTGTLHTWDADSNLLLLLAHRGIPDFLLPKMTKIPIGKGMAGIAAAREEPVQICNLQTDESGVARPSAKETKVAGSLAIPLLDGEALCGVLGVAKAEPYEFPDEEIEVLMALGRRLARRVSAADANRAGQG